jgi:translation elongation factor EF-4
MREMIAQRFEEQWSRLSEIQRQLINEGQIEVMDDLEAAAIKIRTFVDRIKTAAYGYAGFFDAVNIKSEELAKIYEFDIDLLERCDSLASAVDNVEASLGTDGLPAAIRHLTGLSQETIDIYNRRDEVILSV